MPSLNDLINHPACLMKEKVQEEIAVVRLTLSLLLPFPTSGNREQSEGGLPGSRVNTPAPSVSRTLPQD